MVSSIPLKVALGGTVTWFEQLDSAQYTRELVFSPFSLVSQGVCGSQKSVNTA